MTTAARPGSFLATSPEKYLSRDSCSVTFCLPLRYFDSRPLATGQAAARQIIEIIAGRRKSLDRLAIFTDAPAKN